MYLSIDNKQVFTTAMLPHWKINTRVYIPYFNLFNYKNIHFIQYIALNLKSFFSWDNQHTN